MASSPPAHDPRRAQRQSQPLPDAAEPVQVAPYLTHVVAHHGQLTLIPPQNAGRIRKSKSKKQKKPSARDRRPDDDEPRFTTAVPPSSSRKLHPAPAHIRTRKHAISAPSPTTPTTPRRFDPVPDDQSIPDYPPPSFEDAIASPHVPPHLVSLPSSQNGYIPSEHSSPAQHPYASGAASTSSATLLSSSTAYRESPAISQVSLTRPPDPLPPLNVQHPLAAASSTVLPSPAVTASDSTALSDMSLLRPPRTRPVQPSPLAQATVRPGAAIAAHLTSPSTATLSPVTVMREPPVLPQVIISRPQQTQRGPSPEPVPDLEAEEEEPESPLVEPLSPLSPPTSPHLHYRGSVSTVSDIVEELSFEPNQRWSADRRLGLSLEQRVQREFERRNTKEAKEAFGIVPHPGPGAHRDEASLPDTPSSSMPSTPPRSPSPYARRCSHCGSVRPRECGDTQTIDEHSDEEEQDDDDEDDNAHFAAARRGSPLPSRGRSPYLHPARGHHHDRRARFGSVSPEPGSPPASPLSPSMSIFKMPSAWASSVTLSLANALGPHKTSPSSSSSSSAAASTPGSASGSGASSPGAGLKRKESFGVKRLFGSLKGKEREREREYAQLPAPSSSVSSSDTSLESIDGWEVVGGESTGTRSPTTSPTSPARSPTSPARSTESSSPISESARSGAFLNRRLRPTTLPLIDSPTTPTSASPFAHTPTTPSAPHTSHAPATTAAARPYPPEKSPLRLMASANHLRQLQAPPASSPVSAPAPRALRPTPSVIWKPKAPAAVVNGNGSPNGPGSSSPVQRSPLSHQAYHPQPQPQVHPQPPSQPQFLQPSQSPAGPRAPEPPVALTQSAPSLSEITSASSAGSASTPHTSGSPLRRRRAVTPPPAHRRAMLMCDTSAAGGPDPFAQQPQVGTGVGAVGEPGSVPASNASIEQLMARTASTATNHTHTPTTPSRAALLAPATPGSTPTTPTFPAASGSQHYRGRPLPQPPSSEREADGPVKRVPDGFPVNRVQDVDAAEGQPPPPPVLADVPPPPVAATPAPVQMQRSESGDSVEEDVRAAEEGPRTEFLQVTDLDVLAARLVEGEQARDGQNYEDLLLVSEIIGPAAPPATAKTALPGVPSEKATVPYIGTVEVERRRVLKDGRVKLKLSLLGVAVDRCGVCLSQFRRAERGALTPVCRHPFHEACLRRWLRTAGVCPICRMVLSMDA